MNEFDELNEITELSRKIADSPFGRIIWQALGMEKKTFAQNMRTGLCDALDVSLVSVCAKASDWVLSAAPSQSGKYPLLSILYLSYIPGLIFSRSKLLNRFSVILYGSMGIPFQSENSRIFSGLFSITSS